MADPSRGVSRNDRWRIGRGIDEKSAGRLVVVSSFRRGRRRREGGGRLAAESGSPVGRTGGPRQGNRGGFRVRGAAQGQPQRLRNAAAPLKASLLDRAEPRAGQRKRRDR